MYKNKVFIKKLNEKKKKQNYEIYRTLMVPTPKPHRKFAEFISREYMMAEAGWIYGRKIMHDPRRHQEEDDFSASLSKAQ